MIEEFETKAQQTTHFKVLVKVSKTEIEGLSCKFHGILSNEDVCEKSKSPQKEEARTPNWN